MSNLREELREEFQKHQVTPLKVTGTHDVAVTYGCTCGWENPDEGALLTGYSEHLADVAMEVNSDRLEKQVHRVVDKGFELIGEVIKAAREKRK